LIVVVDHKPQVVVSCTEALARSTLIRVQDAIQILHSTYEVDKENLVMEDSCL